MNCDSPKNLTDSLELSAMVSFPFAFLDKMRKREFWRVLLSPYSYFRDSTGSICAARFAGTVPKITPTIVDVTSEIATDQPVMGMW